MIASSRDLLHDQIHNSGASVGIGQASVAEIEDLNILRATMLAMQRAVLATCPRVAEFRIYASSERSEHLRRADGCERSLCCEMLVALKALLRP